MTEWKPYRVGGCLTGTALFNPVTSEWGETFTHTPYTSDRERLIAERAETKRLRGEYHAQRVLLEQVAWDALAALSNAGIATPAEGYIKASFCLNGDIHRLVQQRDSARKWAARWKKVAIGLRHALSLLPAPGRELTEEALAEVKWRLEVLGVSSEENG